MRGAFGEDSFILTQWRNRTSMDRERDPEAVDGDGSQLSISVSVGDVSVEISGRADDVELWYDVVKNDILEPLDDEVIRAAAESTGSVAVPTAQGDGGTAQGSGDEGESPADTDNPSADNSGTDRRTADDTLPEYYKMTDSPTKKDRALLVGWFLTQQGDGEFTKVEVEQEAKDARIELGSNVSRDLRYQVGDGHISKVDESDGSPVYQMTRTGDEYVEEELLKSDG